ncbi:momilactone A synthase-like [Panicum miliaceum]|uniref:Momilactone A synthase-like n=1 Tax=Panicum miliaceum TaxID=4540 RepID=A0A3L6RLK0_PANMI|nr:momilactone A synthase-like [Panicum miliaceum]
MAIEPQAALPVSLSTARSLRLLRQGHLLTLHRSHYDATRGPRLRSGEEERDHGARILGVRQGLLLGFGLSELAGKVAVITGGASGIGKATAAEFVRNGAKVVIADVQDDLGHAVAAELGGPDVACYTRCDVTDEAQVAAAVDLAVAQHGRLDVMFNNASIVGCPVRPPLGEVDLADFDLVMATNGRGVLAGLKHAARVMVPRHHGSIICTASAVGVRLKAAVLGLVRTVAAELARSGVRVNAVSPYAIPTPLAMGTFATWLPGKSAEEIRRIIEVDMSMVNGVVLEAQDIARVALYLASDEAKYVNGHNLIVDGGWTVGKSGRHRDGGLRREAGWRRALVLAGFGAGAAPAGPGRATWGCAEGLGRGGIEAASSMGKRRVPDGLSETEGPGWPVAQLDEGRGGAVLPGGGRTVWPRESTAGAGREAPGGVDKANSVRGLGVDGDSLVRGRKAISFM